MKAVRHICIILVLLFVTLGVPALVFGGFGGDGTDAVSSASLEVPEQPSGRFVVLLNDAKHPGTAAQWEDFFSERPVDVIMDDAACMVIDGDITGKQLAERYQARLAENQMTVRAENPLLVTGRALNGLYDVIVVSQEAADAYALAVPGGHGIAVGGDA